MSIIYMLLNSYNNNINGWIRLSFTETNDLIRMIFMCAMKQVNDMCLGQENASLISCKNI